MAFDVIGDAGGRQRRFLLGVFASLLGAGCYSGGGPDDGGSGGPSTGGTASGGGSSTGGGTAATGGSATGGVTSTWTKEELQEVFVDSYCAGEDANLLEDLSPPQPADYVALRWGGDVPYTFGEFGTPCASGDSAACQADLAAPVTEGFLTIEGMRQHLASTSGDEVGVFVDHASVVGFLGTIDRPGEAILLAYLEGHTPICDVPNLIERDDGYLLYVESGSTCGGNVSGHRLFVARDGTMTDEAVGVVAVGDDGCAIGRLPAGLANGCGDVEIAAAASRDLELGAFFARVAHLEAASVAAFRDLARELEAHGAPRALVEWALRSAEDETRHAVLTGALAARHGAQRTIPRVERRALRSLEEIATDNAVEGLVRETYGALVAHHQARHAKDETIRGVMRTIADDETSHAAFSRTLHDWIVTRLDDEARRRVEGAHEAALDAMQFGLTRGGPTSVEEEAGLPNAETALRLFRGLRRELRGRA